MRRKSLRHLWLPALALLPASCGGTGATPGPAAFSEPDAVEVDGSHYTVELETDRVRVLRIRMPAGHRSPQHRHPEYCAVFLTPADWRFTDPDGVVTEAQSAEGTVACAPAEVHSPENVGSRPVELILFEWKEGDA